MKSSTRLITNENNGASAGYRPPSMTFGAEQAANLLVRAVTILDILPWLESGGPM